MSTKACKQVSPGETGRPPSGVNDAENDQLHHLQPKPKRGDNNAGVEHSTVPVPSSEGSTEGFSLARLLRSLAPQVSLVLENSGSVARDHLANERTWLAYVRTSLSIAGTGVALVQLFTISQSTALAENLFGTSLSLRHFSRPLGATTVLLALCILGVGVLRFFKVQGAMVQGQFPAARITVVVITVALAALVAITFSIVVALPA